MGLDNPIHLALLLIIMLLVFGAKRLPEMGRSLGDGLRGFKEAVGGEAPASAKSEAPSTAGMLAAVVTNADDSNGDDSNGDGLPATAVTGTAELAPSAKRDDAPVV